MYNDDFGSLHKKMLLEAVVVMVAKKMRSSTRLTFKCVSICDSFLLLVYCCLVSLTLGMADSFCELCWCRDYSVTCDDTNVISTFGSNGSVSSTDSSSYVSSMYVSIYD